MSDLQQVLLERFGFAAFRPGQREAIEELLRGGRLLCIQPTGSGKSLLYQLPAALLDGITVVVSPLLALMRDQLHHLNVRFGLRAASVNSDQTDEENEQARRAAAEGRIQLLFVSPEHLDHIERFEAIARLPVRLLVVDEAHCISTWGHDFRPAYRQIVQLVRSLEQRHPELKVLGLTATADSRVEQDIRSQLQSPGGAPIALHRANMDRPNISLAVVGLQGMAQKLAYLGQILSRLPRPGLLYCATREHTTLVADWLRAQGLEVEAYHAGLLPERKRVLQDEFLAGRWQAIVATNALGMGIDKSDLRYVIHVDVPSSITAYYQEVGRAGRDGQPARGILLFDAEDRRIQEHFIDAAQPEPEDFEALLAAAGSAAPGQELGLTALKVATGRHPTRVTVVIAELVEQGYLQKRSAGGKQVYARTAKTGQPDLTRYVNQMEIRTRELKTMLAYGHLTLGCLMASLRRALGDEDVAACGRCSVCRGQRSQVDLDASMDRAQAWLARRPCPIAATSRPEMSEGLALLDSELRGPLIGGFMSNRTAKAGSGALPAELLELLREAALRLGAHYRFGGVVAVPSRSWTQRDEVLGFLAETLGVPADAGLLVWGEEPPARQGELWNNDQRRQNVDGRMRLRRSTPPPAGDLLLLDDFVGSGATLKEVCRVLRKEAKHRGAIVPLTIARVRFRLGARGMPA